MDEFRQIHLAHHGRHHMAVFQVEIIVGAIEVRRHHGDEVGTVLQVVTLAHLQAGNLGDGIGLVGIFQRTGEQGVLRHRLRRFLRVDTGTSQEEQFLHPMGVGLADDVALDLHVHHDEVGAIQAVGHDAAHESGCQHHRIGLLAVEEGLHGRLVGQVHLMDGQAHQIIVSPFLQVIPDGGTHQPGVPCHVDFRILIQHD